MCKILIIHSSLLFYEALTQLK